jgi:hypothetical protein
MSRIKTTKQTVMEMMANQGKTVELMGVVRMIVVKKKKQMMSRIKKTKQTVNEMMDAVMEIMAVMINMMKNLQKKVDIRRNQDLLLTIWLNQKKTCLARVFKTASQRFSGYDTSKTKKTKTRKRKRTTVQYDKSDVFTNCVKTYQKTLNCQILEQKSFFNDGVEKLPTDCTITKKNN